jgi:hypothetical protein
MKPNMLLLQAALSIAEVLPIHMTLLPRAEPTITKDPWQCATENLTQYFDVPKPTGSMLTALLSYADKLYESCTLTELPTGTVLPQCPFPEQSRWCAFTTAAPKSVLSDYSAYGSAANSWWSAHSSNAVSVAQRCPNSWYQVMRMTPNGEIWLNDTIAFAGCYAEAHPITTPLLTTLISATTGSGGVSRTIPPTSSVATPTKMPNSVVGQMGGVEMWAVAGAGLAASAANFVM